MALERESKLSSEVKNTKINDDLVIADKTSLLDLWKKEDWLAIWIGAILIIISSIAVISGAFDFSAAKFTTWGNGTSPFDQLATGEFWIKLIRTFVVTGVLFTAGAVLKGEKPGKYIPASDWTRISGR